MLKTNKKKFSIQSEQIRTHTKAWINLINSILNRKTSKMNDAGSIIHLLTFKITIREDCHVLCFVRVVNNVP